ncbi:MAG: hypothetical protein B5M48_02715 [Candidatus Omnitrophica bacterium 4484_213]|nr:MAG: hypothetical protein B5M48_02715 [Candidatus Omnitrophica bacterium 4484_213]
MGILIALFEDYFWPTTITVICSYLALKFITVTIHKFSELRHKAREYDEHYSEIISLQSSKEKFEKEKKDFETYKKEQIDNINQLIKERSSGVPWLAKAFADCHYFPKLKEANYLELNLILLPSHPKEFAK